jgi:hypothetical protein
MNLAGKRNPDKPFLDIAGGWNQGSLSSGCFACPNVDEAGNFLIADRNANPLYDKSSNNGCTIRFKWQPSAYAEWGLAGMNGVKTLLSERQAFNTDLTAFLYDLAEARGLGDATPAAKAWVTAQWQEIANKPYNNESLRAYVFARLKIAIKKSEVERTPGEEALTLSFANYVQSKRTYLAQQALAMYDTWKAYDDQYRQITGQTKSYSSLFYYGTVPLDFQGMLGSLMAMGGAGSGLLGSLYAANQFAQGVEVTVSRGVATPTRETSLFGMSSGLNIFKSVQGLTAVAGASVIDVAFAILGSVATEQLMAIETARPRLEASLADAQQPVDLAKLEAASNGEDMLYYYWAKAMDREDAEDREVVGWAAQGQALAQQSGYAAPPKTVSIPIVQNPIGYKVSSGTGAASAFTSPGLTQGQKLVSGNGKFSAIMQSDGNFVVYMGTQAIWATNTNNKGRAPYRLAMQPDGNLVVYGSSDQDVTLPERVCRAGSACVAIWATGLPGGKAPYTLQMQDDGNLVMYDGDSRPVWATNTQR